MSATPKLSEAASRLVHTSVDDCKNTLDFIGYDELPRLREALAWCDGRKGQATRRVLLRRRIRHLEKHLPASGYTGTELPTSALPLPTSTGGEL